jgi:hypothetical protein
MNAPWLLRTTHVAACLAGAAGTLAQTDDAELALDRNRLSVGARFSFGVTARVTNVSPAPPVAPDYHNGFVRPDISGNANGQTWYWGYSSDAQVTGDTLNLSTAVESPSDGKESEADGDFQGGFEVVYGRELGRFNLGKRRAHWGVEMGVTSLNTLLETSDTYSGEVTVMTESYSLGGIVPPKAPYAGTYEGPGPLISATPFNQRFGEAAAVSDVRTQIETLLVGLKAGPFLEIPILPRFQANLSAGGVLMFAITDFSFNETVSVTGLPDTALSNSGANSDTQFVPGAYAQASFSYNVTDFLALYLGGQYQYIPDVSFGTGGKEATVDFSSAFELVFGLRTTF